MLNAQKEFKETTNMGEVTSSVSGNQTYDFQMDIESGWLKKCVSRQQIKIETTIVKSEYLPAGLKIPSFTETVFEVKDQKLSEILRPGSYEIRKSNFLHRPGGQCHIDAALCSTL